MTNKEIITKLEEDMKMRNFSHYTYDSYMRKAKEVLEYFKKKGKEFEEVTTEEIRIFLLKHLKEERRLSDRTVNYYNSVIRFVLEVTMDKIINKRQLPMRKCKKELYKVLTKEELSTFFSVCDDFKFKMIFMLIYGSGLRIGEVVKLRVEDIDSENMRIFVREGKGRKERYTLLPKASLKMLRTYWLQYRQNKRKGVMFLNANGDPISAYVIRIRFRRYREKAKINEKITVHTLRHCFATDLIERGINIIQVKELMGHSDIRSTMAYIHVSNVNKNIENPLDAFLKEGGQ